MSLNDVSAQLSTSGLPKILLTHLPSQTVIQDLNLVSAQPSHRNFILGTWVKSYRPIARRQGVGDFYEQQEPAVAESRWEDCWVATDEGGYTVYAWVCSEAGNLYHAYVIPELRHRGVAKALILHSCGPGVAPMARPWPGHSFGQVNPYLLHKKEQSIA